MLGRDILFIFGFISYTFVYSFVCRLKHIQNPQKAVETILTALEVSEFPSSTALDISGNYVKWHQLYLFTKPKKSMIVAYWFGEKLKGKQRFKGTVSRKSTFIRQY